MSLSEHQPQVEPTVAQNPFEDMMKSKVAQNPFEDVMPAPSDKPKAAPKDKRNYLVLLSAANENPALARKVMDNLQAGVDRNAHALWVDGKSAGIFLITSLVASEIRHIALASDKPARDVSDMRDILILEIGDDWYARKEARAEHWLNAHAGKPLAPQGAKKTTGK